VVKLADGKYLAVTGLNAALHATLSATWIFLLFAPRWLPMAAAAEEATEPACDCTTGGEKRRAAECQVGNEGRMVIGFFALRQRRRTW